MENITLSTETALIQKIRERLENDIRNGIIYYNQIGQIITDVDLLVNWELAVIEGLKYPIEVKES